MFEWPHQSREGKLSYLSVCVNSTTAHAIVCAWTQMLLGVLHRRQEKENRRRLSRWVRVLLCISRWPLKVALCHNTLVPTTPAAVKCHRLLLSASQPARFSRQPPPPLDKVQTVWCSNNNRQNRVQRVRWQMLLVRRRLLGMISDFCVCWYVL